LCTVASVEEHKYSYDAESGKYICKCGNTVKAKTVSSSIEYYVSPFNLTERSVNTLFVGYFADGDTMYARFTDNRAGHNNGLEVVLGKDIPSTKGRYMVIKMRTNMPAENAANGDRWNMFINDKHGFYPALGTVCTGDWVIYVLDLAKVYPSFYTATPGGNYPAMSKMFWGTWYSDTVDSFSNYYLDIAYAAIADSMPEILELIGNDTAPMYYSEKSKTGTLMNADDMCKQTHDKYTDNGNGTHNTPSCERCGIVGAPESHTFVYNKDTNTHSCKWCGAIDNKYFSP
jgi:hypothetical protein